MHTLIELPGSPVEGTRWLSPYAVEYVGPGASLESCSVRLRCGTAIQCSHVSVSALAAKVRETLGASMVLVGTGWLNVDAVDAVLPNGSTTIVKLRGGSNVPVDLASVSTLDAALARLAGIPTKVAA